MAQVREQSHETLQTQLADKLHDGKARLQRMGIEWTAARNSYQGVVNKGFGGVDASMVSALLQTQIQSSSDETYLDSLKLMNLTHGLHAKLCISDPAVTTKAYNRDYPNLRAAQLAQIVVEHVRQSTPLKTILEKGPYLNTANLGTGVLFTGWNKDGGRVVEDPQRIEELKAAGKLIGSELLMEGDYEFRNVAPDCFIIDENATEFDVDADWCMELRRIPIERAKWAIPEQADYLDDLSKQLNQDKTHSQKAKQGYEPKRRNAALNMWEYWEKAQPWNGMNGKYVLFVEDCEGEVKILRQDVNPFDHKQLPFAVLTDVDVEDDPYGLSRTVLGMPIQEAVNQLMMQVIANIELHGNIRLLWPEDGTSDDMSSNHPAIRIPYNSALGEKPHYLQPAAVTTDIWRLHTLLMAELDQLFSSTEFDRGEINRELSSFAVQTAIERSEARMVRLFSKKKMFLKRVYEQCLANTIQYATEPRMLKVGGQEEFHNYEFFQGCDLVGEYGIYCDFGMYLPVDPGARKQQVMEIFKSGMFEKAGGNMQKLVSILVDGDMLDVRDLFDQARRVQREEIMRLIEGEPAPVQPYNEHQSHYAELADFTQKQYFETLPEDAKKRILDHMNEHKVSAAKIMAAAQKPATPPATPGAEAPLPGAEALPPAPPPGGGLAA